MSVWPKSLPVGPLLLGNEGALVSVSIEVDPHRLEALLEALAQILFPINPQIYHDAAIVYRYADGREETQDATLVEFPAYESRVEEVRRAVAGHGFDPASVAVTGMLDEIHTREPLEPVPPGVPYVARYRVKRKLVAAH